MAVFIVPTGLSGTDYKSTMRNAAVITFQFFFGNEMYGCVIFIEVVRHSLDLLLDTCKISTFLCYYETLSCVFLSGSKFRILSASYRFKRCFNRDRVLFAVFDTINTTDCIRVALAYAFAPECIIFTIGQDCICIHSVEGEHSRIPAYGNDSDMITLGSCLIYICKMLRDSCVGIKAVNNVEPLCVFRGLNRKICRTSSTENQNVNFIFHFFCFIYMIYFCCICKNFYGCRITTCKYGNKLQIRIVFNCTFYSSAKVAIT